MTRSITLFAVLTMVLLASSPAWAVTIPTVPVDDAGNTADATAYGAVAYDYRIGTTEVTNAQYVEFLNAVAATDTYGLYNTSMGSSTQGGITRSGSGTIPDPYVYAVKADAGSYTYADKPVVYVSWGDAARFANWLNNGQPTGAEDASTTEDGAYALNGATTAAALNAVVRNVGATWFIPSEDEWYKAAYYDGSTYYDYATGTDTTPDNNLPSSDSGNSANFYDSGHTTGDSNYPMTDAGAYTLSVSPYGTFDQTGNVWEWNEALISGSYRGWRGGSWDDGSALLAASFREYSLPTGENITLGFRVATVPEPSTVTLAAFVLAALSAYGWRRRKRGSGRSGPLRLVPRPAERIGPASRP